MRRDFDVQDGDGRTGTTSRREPVFVRCPAAALGHRVSSMESKEDGSDGETRYLEVLRGEYCHPPARHVYRTCLCEG